MSYHDNGNGTVTVRTNNGASISGGSILIGGSISGHIPAGATITGKDTNRNHIPDILERAIRAGNVVFD
jgi:septum formation inhibitor MinC